MSARRKLKPHARLQSRSRDVGIVDAGCSDARSEIAELADNGRADIAGAADHDRMKAGCERERGIHVYFPCLEARSGGAVDSRTIRE